MSLSENIPAHYRDLLDKPVAILGADSIGRAAAALLAKLKVSHVLYDSRVGDDDEVLRAFDANAAACHRLVVHSPSFRNRHPWIESALAAGCCVTSELDFAQQFRRGPTLVVMGTNGKTTLQEFITFSLKRIGFSAMAVGQNAYPLSRLAVHEELDGVTAVCELSGSSLESLKSFRFDALFWTNFHEDHHTDEEQRRQAFDACRRLLHLSPSASFYVGESVFAAAEELQRRLPAELRPSRAGDLPQWDLPAHSAFATSIHLPALALFRRFWSERGYADSLLKSAAEHFEVRAHRLHLTTRIGRTPFWNDANASNFAATKVALDNFTEPVVWIGGGHYRGGDLARLVEPMRGRLRGAVITGNAAWHLLPMLEDAAIPCKGALNLRAAVESAFDMAQGESPVVFSPGFVPGDDFGDLSERGICFENAVLGLKHQKGSV